MRGEGTVIAGAGHSISIRDLPRLINTYGGTAQEWVKMSSKSIELIEVPALKKGTKIQTHYYKNIVTGQVVEIKPKLSK